MFDFGLLNCVNQIIIIFTKRVLTYIYIGSFCVWLVQIFVHLLLTPTVFSAVLKSVFRSLTKTENLFNKSDCHNLLPTGAIMLINCISVGNNGSSSPFRSNRGKALYSPASTRTLIFICSVAPVKTSAVIFCFSSVLVHYAHHCLSSMIKNFLPPCLLS